MRFNSQITIIVDIPMAELMNAKFYRGPAGALLTRDILPPVTIKAIEATSTRLPLYLRPADLANFADQLAPEPSAVKGAAVAASSWGAAISTAAAIPTEEENPFDSMIASSSSSSNVVGKTAAVVQKQWIPTLPLTGVKQEFRVPKPPPPPLPPRTVQLAVPMPSPEEIKKMPMKAKGPLPLPFKAPPPSLTAGAGSRGKEKTPPAKLMESKPKQAKTASSTQAAVTAKPAEGVPVAKGTSLEKSLTPKLLLSLVHKNQLLNLHSMLRALLLQLLKLFWRQH
jgi:hypothetical protein